MVMKEVRVGPSLVSHSKQPHLRTGHYTTRPSNPHVTHSTRHHRGWPRREQSVLSP
jgi:hypothetical protein